MDDPDSLRLVKGCRENIGKACRVFFHYGSIGDLSPLSTRFIIKACAVSALLFGSEN